jgi:hypothetical protein
LTSTKASFDFTGTTHVCSGGQRLDLLGGYAWIGGVQIDGTENMLDGPFDESVRVIGDGSERRIGHMLEDGVENWACMLGEFPHKLAEFAVEVSKKQQGLVAQHREARVMNAADRVLRRRKSCHHWWEQFRQGLGVRRRLQREAQREMILAH